MTSLKSVTLIPGLIVGAGLSSPLSAHESRPLYIEITELAGDVYSLQWKVPRPLSWAIVPRLYSHKL